MVLAEQDDEWQDGRRYFRPETMVLIDAIVDHQEFDGVDAWQPARQITQRQRQRGLLVVARDLNDYLHPSSAAPF